MSRSLDVHGFTVATRRAALVAAAGILVCLAGQAAAATTVAEIYPDGRPWTRWWWFSGPIEEKDIRLPARLGSRRTASAEWSWPGSIASRGWRPTVPTGSTGPEASGRRLATYTTRLCPINSASVPTSPSEAVGHSATPGVADRATPRANVPWPDVTALSGGPGNSGQRRYPNWSSITTRAGPRPRALRRFRACGRCSLAPALAEGPSATLSVTPGSCSSTACGATGSPRVPFAEFGYRLRPFSPPSTTTRTSATTIGSSSCESSSESSSALSPG